MLDRKYDPTQPYCVVWYGRMSNTRQNKRSPDQQFATIEETLRRCGYPWQCVRTYRDDGVTGRLVRKRPAFQAMLRDIEAGLMQIDLIVVDTYERLGRAEEIGFLRYELFTSHGVLVVAADNNFSDPTGIVGKAVGMVEQMRATENTRISRHNVIRGKKDTARLRRWPGAPRPFGYLLKPVVDQSCTPPDVYNVLEIEPREAAALLLAFRRAAETGEGDLRLSKWWNASADIPDEFKPVSPFTMGYRLSNRLYVGELIWGANRTGIVKDTRVVEPNPDGAEIVPDFCPPLVSRELFDCVQQQRQVRSQQVLMSRQKNQGAESGKRIAPQVRGLTLKYLLTGLVRCGCCNASMRPVPSGRRSKAGRTYVYYTCPRHYEGACPNARHMPEDQLRLAVLSRLRVRLFPPPAQPGETPSWLPELIGLVEHELRLLRQDEPDRVASARKEREDLEKKIAGWTMTLADPLLPAAVRADLVAHYQASLERKQHLEQSMQAEESLNRHVSCALNPDNVLAQLKKLEEVLAGFNPTLGNLELSKHIDRIDCHPDGRIHMRGTLLGLFEGGVQLLSRPEVQKSEPVGETSPFAPVKPRRRGRLRLPSLTADSASPAGDLDTSLDPQRFAGLTESFFWGEEFVIEPKRSWAEEYADEVYEMKERTGKSFNELAKEFGKSRPTVQHAWKIAAARRQQGGGDTTPPSIGPPTDDM